MFIDLFLKGMNRLEMARSWQYVFQFTGLLIILSIVFIKQHVIIDVFSGIILAEVINRMITALQQEKMVMKQEHF